MQAPQALNLVDLLPKIDLLLIELLENLSPEEWLLPTIVPGWRVKDIAAHLLDGNLRSLSMLRDGFYGEQPGQIESHQDLVGFLDRL
ncbi:MAG: maleylpyruvate isomerase N-terminal domain-containing protein, partial [Bacteroidota bacterium]